MDLLKFSEKVKKLARRLKLDDAELLVTNTRILSARLENQEITLELNEAIFAAGLRVIKRNKIGYVPITEPNFDLLERGIKTALVRAAPAPFPSFVTINEQPPEIPASDPAIVQLQNTPARLQEIARDLLRRAYDTGKIETIEGAIRIEHETRLVTTLHSTYPACTERTGLFAFAEVNSKDYDFVVGRRLPEIEEITALGAKVAKGIPDRETTPEAEGIKGKTVPVIVCPEMLEEILRRLVAEHLYAATVQEGMSRFHLGEPVASELVTLWDDATVPYGGNTFPTDDEGTPSRKNLIIKNGILQMFLYDRASAWKDGVESTGNGKRRPLLIEDEHEAPVRCTINDVYLAPGDKPLAEMIKNIDHGVMVKLLLGFHTANKTTGDFTNTLYFGRIINNGEITALPEPGRWSIKGNALACLKTVKAVSQETKSVGNGVLPWVQMELTVA